MCHYPLVFHEIDCVVSESSWYNCFLSCRLFVLLTLRLERRRMVFDLW